MNIQHDFDAGIDGAETTTLMQLVAAVDEYTDSTEETVHVIRHMLMSRRVSFEGQPERLQLDPLVG